MTKHLELPFDWSEQVDDLPSDTLERSEHARFLTAFLVDKGTNGNYVLNLDAQWGAGKTWFIRRWMNEIKETHPTVYIDAWKNDHCGDPFLTVVSEIKSALISKSEFAFFERNVLKGAWRFMKSVAPEVTKCVIKNKLGIDTDNLDLDSEADLGSKLVDELLKAHGQANSSAEDFKKSIGEWLEAVIDFSEKKYSYPMFIFIDELDRCRPTYAIEMLETIKHLFDIKRVVFVISTDKEQLIHSICSVYGTGFDARRYLDRFFMRSVTLKKKTLKDFIELKLQNSVTFSNAIKNKQLISHDTQTAPYETILKVLTVIADGFSMDLRTTNLWFERIESIYSHSIKNIEILSLSFILALYTRQSNYYHALMSGVNIFSFNSENSVSRVFKNTISLETNITVRDIGIENLLSFQYNFKIDDYTFSENIPVINLVQIILNIIEYRNMASIEDKRNNLALAIYNNRGNPNIADKAKHIFGGNSLELNRATDIYISCFFKDNQTNLQEYNTLCDLAVLLE
ncbi:KAP family P-loop NTPase fold protein [Enterobacter soli]|uniref:KAP family P-loop NTPase fold protein n=1 Tax=Enterobacter soli TaxID=885040 RepID=UPI0034CE2756